MGKWLAVKHEHLLDEILPLVSKPARYTGNEWNAVRKDWDQVAVKVALAFPDIYDVGMGHLGYKILYHILNSREDTLAERVYAPWVDMEAKMREHNLPLFSLETRHELNRFDLVGFTLQYELSYTNVLNMLDLGNIPLLAAERKKGDPFVIGGGPCAFNPEPLADFFDLFVIGAGEEALPELVDLYRQWSASGGDRKDFLRQAAQMEGVYVPAFYTVKYNGNGTIQAVEPVYPNVPRVVRKRVIKDLDAAPFPDRFVVPYVDVIHDRVMLEVMRGCTRSCRFCQAGMIYRPVRERRPETLRRQAEALVRNTGYEEISLTSLSTGDYGAVEDVARDLLRRYGPCGVALSLPSLRLDSFSVNLANEIQKQRKTGLTFAPEAGSQRLRNVINKNVTDENLFTAARAAFAAGWDSIKLYFMIGLPTETKEDIAGIARLAQEVLQLGRKVRSKKSKGHRVKVSLSVATFVPKSHTPFQWEAQDSLQVLEEKQAYLHSLIQDRAISFSWHDARTSFLEAVLARGDRRLAAVLQRAWQNGCKFDSWSEQFKFDIWMEAFASTGIDPLFYSQRQRDKEEILPWDHIHCGVSKAFLWKERERALAGQVTPDCRFEGCQGCGVCVELGVDNVLVGGENRAATES